MKKVKINPSYLKGTINIPTSKSYAHRALICAALCKEEILIKNISMSEDIEATINCLRQLGVKVSIFEANSNLNILVNGENLFLIKDKNITIYCNESGSTLRFMVPIVSMLGARVILKGKSSLMSRPMNIYETIFSEQKLYYCKKENEIEIEGPLKNRIYKIPGNISSQFLTGLFFILPILTENSKIIVTTELQSEAYIDMTIEVMKTFGVIIDKVNSNQYFIKGNQKYSGQNIKYEYIVEGDYSQAAFWLVAGSLNGNLDILGLNKKSIQGDKIIIDILKKLKANITEIEDGYRVKKSDIKLADVNVKECPDLVPILALLFTKGYGVAQIVDAERVRFKESDRLKAITLGLNNLGASILEKENSLLIEGNRILKTNIVDSFNDHRIEMSLAIAGTMSDDGCIIRNALSINKSYPKFYEDLKKVGGIFTISE